MWYVNEICEHDDGHYNCRYYFKSKSKAELKKKELYKSEYDKYMETNDGNYDAMDPEQLFINLANDNVYDYEVFVDKIVTED